MADDVVNVALSSGEWKKISNQTTGKTYFYNPVTKKTVWDLKKELGSGTIPSSAPVIDDSKKSRGAGSLAEEVDPVAVALATGMWKENTDANGKKYYYNPSSKKTVWNLRKELETIESPPCILPSNASSAASKSGEELAVKALESGEWKQMTDSKSGKTYYYNLKSKATIWDLAKELAGRDPQSAAVEEKTVAAIPVNEVKPIVTDAVQKQQVVPNPLLLELESLRAEKQSMRSLLQYQEDEIHHLRSLCGAQAPRPHFSSPQKLVPALQDNALQLRVEHLLHLNQRLQTALSEERKKRNLCARCAGFLEQGRPSMTVAQAMAKGMGHTFSAQPAQMSDGAWSYSAMNSDASLTSYPPQSHAQFSLLSRDDVFHHPMYVPGVQGTRGTPAPEQLSQAASPKQDYTWKFPTAKYLNQ